MHRHVNAIAGRLSLRPPQRQALEILDRVAELRPPRQTGDVHTALTAIQHEFPTVTDFERAFPSLCFALATGVGKTRLMGAFISYLHLAHGIDNFFVLAPNLTIYNKLITDFTPNTPKYVFKGIAEFATEPPEIITGDDYQYKAGTLFDQLIRVKINIFNISKINSEVRGGRAPRIKRLSEYIGESYFDYLAGRPDLVLLMDESHRYRASAGVRAINELNPVLGLELTATPFVETSRGTIPFKNVIYDYPLARAMADGFVKEPAVVTQKNFDPQQFTPTQLEEIKLQDGIRLHENTKVALDTYARQTGQPIVKPFMLVIARDTAHAGQLVHWMQSEQFFAGQYKDKIIQVDSSRTGAEEDAVVQRLLAVENPDEPTEIVVHVNMLKEGWDVTNLYTIVPLRAAHARILIEQSIGRGLRLPYGRRTGVTAVDRLNIVAHDKFQEIIDEANRPDSPLRVQQVVLDPATDLQKMVTVLSSPHILEQLGTSHALQTATTHTLLSTPEATFTNEAERKIAETTYKVIKQYEILPNAACLLHDDVQHKIVEEVAAAVAPTQLGLAGVSHEPDIAYIVRKTTSLVVQHTIDIPRILVVPRGEISSGFHPFQLDTASIHYQPIDRDLLIQHLRTREQETLHFGTQMPQEQRLEDYLVRGLIDFDDISYDDHADLLYDLAGQMVKHLLGYLSAEEARNVLIYHQHQLALFIHTQMRAHYWEQATGYDVVVSKGFTELKSSAYTTAMTDEVYDVRDTVREKNKIAQMVFAGFQRCLYRTQKFQSDAERLLALILDREALKWFKPARGQFQLYYKLGTEHLEYQPDFVAETLDDIYMLEAKARNDMHDPEVQAKQEAAVQWCQHATRHALSSGGKPWQYLLIPHDAIRENMSLVGLASQYRGS